MQPFHIDKEHPLKAAILGCTGSVGLQALEVMEQLGCRIVMLSASRNAELVARQARKYRPRICTMDSQIAADSLRLMLAGEDIRIYGGRDAVCRALAECGADLIIHSIAGLAGLPSALAAAATGARVGMANKEAIIAAGGRIYAALQKSGGEMIPVDSEHSAIFQCLTAAGAASPSGIADNALVRRILLTASGGPFFGMERGALSRVTPEQALSHPTWKMGRKITIDSATLMNKGFEIIEAVRLFGVPVEKIEVLVHRQSIIHSMVEYIDNSVIAQLAAPDMRGCIRYAATYPTRAWTEDAGLDFPTLHSLTFEAPDRLAFPLLDTARTAIRRGGIVPTALIAADEEAVDAFIAGRISFPEIADVVTETLEITPDQVPTEISHYYEAEAAARVRARRIIEKTVKRPRMRHTKARWHSIDNRNRDFDIRTSHSYP